MRVENGYLGDLEVELFVLYKELVMCDKLDRAGLHDSNNLRYYREYIVQDIISLHAQINEKFGTPSEENNFIFFPKDGCFGDSPSEKFFETLYQKARNDVRNRLRSVV